MQRATCRCGKLESWHSGIVYPRCHGCEECGTNTDGEPLQPHEWVEMVKGPAANPTPYRQCRRCRKREAQDGRATPSPDAEAIQAIAEKMRVAREQVQGNPEFSGKRHSFSCEVYSGGSCNCY